MKKMLTVITAVMVGIIFSFPATETSAQVASDKGSDKTPSYVENQVIVVMEDGQLNRAEAKATEAVTKEEGKKAAEKIEVSTVSEEDNAVLVESEKNIDEAALCKQLNKMDGVEYAQPNFIYETDSASTSSGTDDTYASSMWNLDYIDAKEAWDLIDTLKKADPNWAETHVRIKVATLDTGTNMNHEDLTDMNHADPTKRGNLDVDNCVTVTATSTDGEEYAYEKYDKSTGGHGTGTAGVIGATSNNKVGVAGVAAGNNNNIISLMAIDIFNYGDGHQYLATTADTVAGIDYAVDKGAKVIMMCLGHSNNTKYNDGKGNVHDDTLLEEKINWASNNENDAIVVASAGNNNNADEWLPSDFEACISCINTQQYSDIDSSNCKYSGSSYGPKKDISAPGTKVTLIGTGTDEYRSGTGTSYAAPTVAAVAALVRYVAPNLSQQQVKDILYSTTTDLYTPGKDDYTGWGNVNAYNAVSKACGKNDRLPVTKLATPAVSARSNSGSSIQVSWTPVAGAQKYYIYRSTSAGGSFDRVKTVSGSTTSWINTSRTFNKKYYYAVQARGTSSDGKRLDGATSKVSSAAAVCGIPTLKAKAKGKNKAKVSWSKATNASGYKIYRATSMNGKYKCIKTLTKGKKGSITVKKLKSKKTYYYKVRAYKKKGSKKYYTGFSDAVMCTQK